MSPLFMSFLTQRITIFHVLAATAAKQSDNLLTLLTVSATEIISTECLKKPFKTNKKHMHGKVMYRISGLIQQTKAQFL